jgi:hypothetical protein
MAVLTEPGRLFCLSATVSFSKVNQDQIQGALL